MKTDSYPTFPHRSVPFVKRLSNTESGDLVDSPTVSLNVASSMLIRRALAAVSRHHHAVKIIAVEPRRHGYRA